MNRRLEGLYRKRNYRKTPVLWRSVRGLRRELVLSRSCGIPRWLSLSLGSLENRELHHHAQREEGDEQRVQEHMLE